MVELASALVAPIAKLLLKSWLGDTGADVGDNLLRLAFNRLGDWAKAQVALQRAESIAREVVKELETFFAREQVNRQQLEVAAYEVGETIRACVGARFLVQQKLNVQEIERGLLEARPLDRIYTPSEPERGAYIGLVRALAPRLRAVAPEVPGFELERDATLDGESSCGHTAHIVTARDST